MEDINKLKQAINRTKAELTILYEISNALGTTLDLEEIFYIILTGVTAHVGLGFSRAMLFLVNEKKQAIEGKMGIGPVGGEEANKIWTKIQKEQMSLDDLISAYKSSKKIIESKFNQQVKSVKISIKEGGSNLLVLAAQDGMPLHITKGVKEDYSKDILLQILKTDELVIVPLKAKDKVNGLIVADNISTQKPITKDDMRMFIMLSNQAGLAIENSQLYEQTVIRSHRNSLTGLWNHGYFQYLLKRELKRAKKEKLFLSIIMIDIDDFKKYNDTSGHQAGDEILKDMAKILLAHSRKNDRVCRYGGEEFAIILPETSKKETITIAERIREKIANRSFNHMEVMPDKRFTVSLGVSSFPEDGSLNSELISAADKLLYKAKNQGKNKVCY